MLGIWRDRRRSAIRKGGRWLSSVKRLVWDQETASSNLARPTITFPSAENVRFRSHFDRLGRRWARGWNGCGKLLEHAELRDFETGLPITREAKMGAVKHSVRVVNESGFAVPVRRQPPLVVGYAHFRLDRQGQLLSPKTVVYYDEKGLPFLRWLEAEGVRRFDEVDVGRVRTFRANLAARMGKYGRPLAPKTILECPPP